MRSPPQTAPKKRGKRTLLIPFGGLSKSRPSLLPSLSPSLFSTMFNYMDLSHWTELFMRQRLKKQGLGNVCLILEPVSPKLARRTLHKRVSALPILSPPCLYFSCFDFLIQPFSQQIYSMCGTWNSQHVLFPHPFKPADPGCLLPLKPRWIVELHGPLQLEQMSLWQGLGGTWVAESPLIAPVGGHLLNAMRSAPRTNTTRGPHMLEK